MTNWEIEQKIWQDAWNQAYTDSVNQAYADSVNPNDAADDALAKFREDKENIEADLFKQFCAARERIAAVANNETNWEIEQKIWQDAWNQAYADSLNPDDAAQDAVAKFRDDAKKAS